MVRFQAPCSVVGSLLSCVHVPKSPPRFRKRHVDAITRPIHIICFSGLSVSMQFQLPGVKHWASEPLPFERGVHVACKHEMITWTVKDDSSRRSCKAKQDMITYANSIEVSLIQGSTLWPRRLKRILFCLRDGKWPQAPSKDANGSRSRSWAGRFGLPTDESLGRG